MSGGLIAGVEAGGTKFVCGVGPSPTEILRTCRVATTDPESTLDQVTDFLKTAQVELGPISSIGVASFGPLDLDPTSPTWGCITTTPKAGWSGFDLRGALVHALDRPVAIDTDVAGAGLSEWTLGAGQGLGSLAYVTVGTGIGGALIVNGRPLHGLGHSEMGHIPVRRHPDDAAFAGSCPYHGCCLEGLASGPSVIARYGVPLSDLPASAPIWSMLADYLAQLCLSITLISAPERIVLGGGVLSNPALLPMTRRAFLIQNNGYVAHLADAGAVEAFLAPPGLADRAGLIGAMLLADEAFRIRPRPWLGSTHGETEGSGHPVGVARHRMPLDAVGSGRQGRFQDPD